VYETAKETLMYRSVLWTLWERERVGRFGRMTLLGVKIPYKDDSLKRRKTGDKLEEITQRFVIAKFNKK